MSRVVQATPRVPRGAERALPDCRYGNEVGNAGTPLPARPAVVDDDGELTYAELERTTDALARALTDRGAGPGAPVGLLWRNGRAPIQVRCAAGKIGADVVLLNTGLSLPLKPPHSRMIVLTSGTTGTPKGARRPRARARPQQVGPHRRTP